MFGNLRNNVDVVLVTLKDDIDKAEDNDMNRDQLRYLFAQAMDNLHLALNKCEEQVYQNLGVKKGEE